MDYTYSKKFARLTQTGTHNSGESRSKVRWASCLPWTSSLMYGGAGPMEATRWASAHPLDRWSVGYTFLGGLAAQEDWRRIGGNGWPWAPGSTRWTRNNWHCWSRGVLPIPSQYSRVLEHANHLKGIRNHNRIMRCLTDSYCNSTSGAYCEWPRSCSRSSPP